MTFYLVLFRRVSDRKPKVEGRSKTFPSEPTVTAIPVCIFAKPPVPGQAKTRLARSIGEDSAASLASAMLCDIWSVVREIAEAIPVLAAAEEGTFPVTVPEENFWLQGTGNFGSRIENILRRGLSTAPAAIVLGADSPLITAGHLRDALHQLQSSDAVMGPACDGGFYLLGLRKCPFGLLQGVPWSTAEAGQSTEDCLHSQGMSVSQLRMLPDVDTVADLQSLYDELKNAAPTIAPATQQWFFEHRARLREFQWSAS